MASVSGERIESRICRRLREMHQTLATAESCTGGLIGHRLTDIPGSSVYYLGGVIAYSNQAKIQLLDVCPETLEAQGAVSESVVREMAEGARLRFGADYAVAVTGIAGPTGGAPEKPVGLVYIAFAEEMGTHVFQNHFVGAREQIKCQTADKALAITWEHIA